MSTVEKNNLCETTVNDNKKECKKESSTKCEDVPVTPVTPANPVHNPNPSNFVKNILQQDFIKHLMDGLNKDSVDNLDEDISEDSEEDEDEESDSEEEDFEDKMKIFADLANSHKNLSKAFLALCKKA